MWSKGDISSAWIEDRSRRVPDDLAISHATATLTFGELGALVDSWVGFLRDQLGPDPGVIALSAPQTPGLVAALHGIMRSGGIVLYLRPDEAPDRRLKILQQARPSLSLFDPAVCSAEGWLEAPIDFNTVALPSGGNIQNVPLPNPMQPAQVVFTSGSTGSPVGVVISHAALAYKAKQEATLSDTTSSDRLGQQHSLGWAASLGATFSSPLCGAPLCLIEPLVGNVARYLDEVEAQAPTFLGMPAAHLRLIASAATTNDSRLASVRFLKLSGAAVGSHDLRAGLRVLSPHAAIEVAYGSSEANAITRRRVTQDSRIEAGPAVAGHVVPDIETRVVDQLGALVGPGVLGALEVRTTAPRRWPLDSDSDLNSQTRDPRPLSEPVWVSVGDNVIEHDDGRLEVRGRANSRVKLNGIAIDLREIERALVSLPDVDEAVALVDRRPGRERLCGFVASANPIDQRSIGPSLRHVLPPYSIPVLYQFRELPRTDRGKIDRDVLEELARSTEPGGELL